MRLKDSRVLTISSLLVSLGILAGFFKISVSNILEIRLVSLPIALAGAVFGPGIAAIIGMLSDLGGYMVATTGPYFPGFTLSYGLTGILYGLILKDGGGNSVSLKRVILSVTANALLVSILLNSLWLNILYPGRGFYAVMSARVLKEIIMIPVYVILITAILKPMLKFYRGDTRINPYLPEKPDGEEIDR